MAEFGFTEAQEMFRREIRNFTERELAPGARERAQLEYIPKDVAKKVGDMGILALGVPEKYGGQPGDWVMHGIAAEEIARVDIAIPGVLIVVFTANILGILEGASEELREEWVPPLIKAEKFIAGAITEPAAGSDAAGIQATAVRDGDYYILNGEKNSTTYCVPSDVATVWAKTDPTAGARGVSCFLVPLDLPGITRSTHKDMGNKGLARGTMVMDNVRLPARNLVGQEGKGFYIVMAGFDLIRPLNGLTCLGSAQASLEEAIAFSKQRTAFGYPIAKYEGLSFKIAEDATLIDAARLLCYRALWLRDQGLPFTKEAAMAKWFSIKAAIRTDMDAIFIHGHLGYTEQLPLQQRLRDAIGWEFADGTGEIQKMIIARQLIGKEATPY